MKIRAWGYRDRTILPDGFERTPDTAGAINYRSGCRDTLEALACALAERDAVVALAESAGLEVCLDDDEEGSAAHKAEVERWIGEEPSVCLAGNPTVGERPCGDPECVCACTQEDGSADENGECAHTRRGEGGPLYDAATATGMYDREEG